MPASNIIFMDGFDHYNTTANLPDKWTITNSGMTIVSGRHGGNALRMGSSSDSATKSFGNRQYACVSFGLQIINGYPNSPQVILAFNDGANNQVDLRLNINNSILMTRNGTTLTGGTSNFILQRSAWHWVEVKVMISNSVNANSCQVKINGELIIDLAAGQDTQNTTNAYINSIVLRCPNYLGGTLAIVFDDVIIQTGIGSDFIGDTRIIASLPNGNGDSSDFTGSDGNSTDNYLLVDETNPDDDTTYVQSATIGHKDLYSFPTLGTAVDSVLAVGLDINCRKTDTASRQICSVAKISSVEKDGTNINIADTYSYQIQDILSTNPATNLPWNQSEVESLQIGQKVIS